LSTAPRDLAELRRELRQFQQAERDKKLRAGKAKPRTLREWSIFGQDLLPKRDAPEDGE
jgi:hypothetical protein